ncbi:hypothetical protein KY284_034382 [Solanum tuberosum]|nr:hypothetical protein KY284_034382 [Solanum tuberosum]
MSSIESVAYQWSDDEKVQNRREGRVDRYNDDRKEKRRNVEREKKDDGDDHDRKDTRQRIGADKHGKDKNREDNTQEDGALKASEVSKVQKQDGNLNVDTAKLGRSGGVYIPPFKLAMMMKEVQDKSSVEYQRMTWDVLRKSINGLVNKVNAANLKNIIPELFAENLIRGRGLFCRSCMKSQMASPGFTDVFAALVAVVNTKFPEVGDLLLRRIILQLQRAYKPSAVKFIAHLVNQQIVHELIALELLTVLLEKPTDDSVEVAVGFVTECGIFERFRGILHEGEIDKRVQFLIESLFALRKAKFQGYQAVRPELDLVEKEDQLTHEVSLSDTIDPEITLEAGHKLLKIKLEPGQEVIISLPCGPCRRTQDSLDSIFPKDNPKNTRFAINFFTSIGLGGITENLREYLKNMPRLIMQQQKPVSESDDESGSSGSESESSSSSSDDSDSESDDSRRKRRRRR